MKIDGQKKENQFILKLIGRLDSKSAPELEELLKEVLQGINYLQMDFLNLEYISSAGLRILLATAKTIQKKEGRMVIINVNEDVMEVFNITGFSDILNIE